MDLQIEAIYRDGVLRPLEPLDLAQDERVRVSITKCSGDTMNRHVDLDFLARLELELRDAPPAPGVDEIRRRLRKIPGSLAADFAAEREEP